MTPSHSNSNEKTFPLSLMCCSHVIGKGLSYHERLFFFSRYVHGWKDTAFFACFLHTFHSRESSCHTPKQLEIKKQTKVFRLNQGDTTCVFVKRLAGVTQLQLYQQKKGRKEVLDLENKYLSTLYHYCMYLLFFTLIHFSSVTTEHFFLSSMCPYWPNCGLINSPFVQNKNM